ncbi:DUF3238 domain-containing protein [Cupriavidus sp. amp6]|uniref:DUF3238 domain-containing protein n=1 Tax=Cupriavidus sp. amp6 TaxID=388051 RepID=UPI00048AA1A2|nr:DUF3238 domain-containing protein [Cupriavidus sp. amp6]
MPAADSGSRAHSEVTIGGLESQDSTVVLGQVHRCGETHELDDDGNIIRTATAPADRILFQNLRGSQTVAPEGGVVDGIPGSMQIDFQGSAANPLMAAPDIDWSGTLTIDREGRRILVKGAVNDFPAFEMYCSVDDGPVLTLLQKQPVSPLDLFGEEDQPYALLASNAVAAGSVTRRARLDSPAAGPFHI